MDLKIGMESQQIQELAKTMVEQQIIPKIESLRTPDNKMDIEGLFAVITNSITQELPFLMSVLISANNEVIKTQISELIRTNPESHKA